MPVPHRSDARRNRAAILRAAVEVFTHGPAVVSLRQVADLAGVGQATVYRHFPDRRALADAVARERWAALARMAVETAGEPDAFRVLLRTVLLCQASMRPLVAVMRRMPVRERRWHVQQVIAILRAPLDRARLAGQVRHDLEPGDLAVVFGMVEAAVEAVTGDPAAGDPAAAGAVTRRAIEFIVDGISANPHGTCAGCAAPPAAASPPAVTHGYGVIA